MKLASALALLAVGVGAQAQDDTLHDGLVPFNSFQGANIDSVNLSNGNLALAIPLFSYKQRGRLPALKVLVRGNSATWFNNGTVWSIDPSFPPGPPGLQGPVVPNRLKMFIAPLLIEQAALNYIDKDPPSDLDYGSVIAAVDSSGASHILGQAFARRLATQTPPAFPVSVGHVSDAADGSGIREISRLTLLDSSGNTWHNNGVTDVFGNNITVGGNFFSEETFTAGVTDSLGRNIPAPPSFTIPSTPGCTTLDFPGQNGVTVPVTFCYASFAISTAFPVGNGQYSATWTLLQSIALPNGTWTFNYNSYGDISSITLPTGGTISYSYENLIPCSQQPGNPNAFRFAFSRAVATRTLDAKDGTPTKIFTYTYNGTNTTGATTTVNDPDKNDTVHTFTLLEGAPSCTPFETMAQIYQGLSTQGVLLKTTGTNYSDSGRMPFHSLAWSSYNVFPKSATITLPNGQVSQETYQYDQSCATGGGTFPVSCGKILQKTESDFGNGAPGPILRQTVYQYVWQADARYKTANLLNTPCVVTVYGPGSLPTTTGCTVPPVQTNQIAQTTYGYDENNGSPQGVFGNQTSLTRWLSGGVSPTSRTVYNAQGMPVQLIDPKQNITTITYDSTGLFPSSIQQPDTNGVHHIDTYSYDANTGQLISHTDQNQQQTSYSYDSMRRPKGITYPDGGSVTYDYTDAPPSSSATANSSITSSANLTVTGTVDGFGREVSRQTAVPTSTCASGQVTVTTQYDNLSRTLSVSNPYCTTADPTYGTTSYQYDALGRTKKVTNADGTSAALTYTGRATQTQDAGNGNTSITRIAQQDGLGRVVALCEVTGATQAGGNTPGDCKLDSPGTGFLTTYQYDSLDNLKSVQQGAVVRSFAYDTLSRMSSVAHPESGATSYSYDNNGNILTRVRPAPNQGNPQTTIKTSYQYDALDRQTQVSYSDSATPTVFYRYDTTSELGISLLNTVGRLSNEYTQDARGNILSARVYSYDAMGRIKENPQCTPQNCPNNTTWPVAYSYDLRGDVLSATNGVGVTFTYGYDSAARLSQLTSSLSDATHPAVLYSGLQYNPLGLLTGSSLGTLNEAFNWDCRGRLLSYFSAVAPFINSGSVLNSSGCPNTTAINSQPSRLGVPDPAFQLASLLNPERGSQSILLSGKASRKKDHGVVKVMLAAPSPLLKPEVISIPYQEGETALSVAQRLAQEVNQRGSSNLKVTVRPVGSGAIIDVKSNRSDPWSRLQASVQVSINSNRTVPSIRASSLRPPGGTPSLLGRVQTSWMEGQ